MSQILEEFASSMAFRRGGAEGLHRAIDSKAICTAEYDSGVQASGVIAEALCDAVGNVTYIRTEGPTQLAWRGTELFGHGTSYHAQGFGSPVGLLKDFSRCLSEYTVDELKAHDIVVGRRARLEFLSGITVSGVLDGVLRQEQRNLILSFNDCTVVDLDGRVLFDPAWGCYDMAVGGRIASVFGGVADRERFQLYKPLPRTVTPGGTADPSLMQFYEKLTQAAGDDVDWSWVDACLDAYPQEWLLRVELLRFGGDSLPSELRARALTELAAADVDGAHRYALDLVLASMGLKQD